MSLVKVKRDNQLKNLKHCIQTYSGAVVDLSNPQEEDIFLCDIFHSLAFQNRFTGHTRVPYSIAEHSILVSRLVPEQHLKLAGLAHDFSEGFLADISTPCKSLLPEYKKLESKMTGVILKKLGITEEEHRAIKIWDSFALTIESKSLLGPLNEKLWESYKVQLPEDYDLDYSLLTLKCMGYEEAEIALKNEFNKLWLAR